ncbi:MAG: hypothetical protein AAB383_06040 [Patescibacteria group bacterium]
MQTAFSFKQSVLILAVLIAIAGLTSGCDTTPNDNGDEILNMDLDASGSGSLELDEDDDSY